KSKPRRPTAGGFPFAFAASPLPNEDPKNSNFLLRHRLPGRLDLGFHRLKVEARSLLHGRELDGRLGQFVHLLLYKHEAPEFALEPAEVFLRSVFGAVIGPFGSFPGSVISISVTLFEPVTHPAHPGSNLGFRVPAEEASTGSRNRQEHGAMR